MAHSNTQPIYAFSVKPVAEWSEPEQKDEDMSLIEAFADVFEELANDLKKRLAFED